MSRRYFIEQPLGAPDDEMLLEEAESHHLIHVMRAKVGDPAMLFDGSGREATAEIVEINRRSVRLRVLQCAHVDRELGFELIMGVALPKGDRQRMLIEKLVELGVTRLIPLDTQRSVAEAKLKSITRLERTVIEASKQCGRNRLMQIDAPKPIASFFAEQNSNALRFIASPLATVQLADFKGDLAPASKSISIICAVGPEGGFTESELALATQSGWHSISLGPRILRAETAAITLAAFFSLG
jgi:16S rRNA (uracil1498-N3)-methyltransferase